MDQTAHAQAKYAQARDNMVDGQVRPNKVIDPRIIRAMRSLPRERFVPPHAIPLAYADEDVPLGGGRVLLEPMVIARLVQLARVREGERVLVIGSGPGYGAALMAACGGVVTALEEDPTLLEIARRVLPDVAPGVVLQDGRLLDGGSAGAPWDVIMIEGAVEAIPPGLAEQLRGTGGRLVTVIDRSQGGLGQGVLAEPTAPGLPLRERPEFDCATPLLRPFVAAPTFQF